MPDISPSTIALAAVVVCLALACCIVVVARRLARPPLERPLQITGCAVARVDADTVRLVCSHGTDFVTLDVSPYLAAHLGRQLATTPGAPRPLNRSAAEGTH